MNKTIENYLLILFDGILGCSVTDEEVDGEYWLLYELDFDNRSYFDTFLESLPFGIIDAEGINIKLEDAVKDISYSDKLVQIDAGKIWQIRL